MSELIKTTDLNFKMVIEFLFDYGFIVNTVVEGKTEISEAVLQKENIQICISNLKELM